MLDLIIIGASAAGVSAAIYAARRKLNFLVVSGNIGGEVLLSGEIENYPGFKHTDGVAIHGNHVIKKACVWSSYARNTD